MTSRDKIVSKALELLESQPNGLRYSELVKTISETFTDIPINTIHGTIWNVETRTNDIYKASRGLFRHTKYKEKEIQEIEEKTSKIKDKIEESEFYKPFAEWLVNEIEECTEAKPLGGNKFKDKWGTPDVIGKRESKRSDIIQMPTEIISAEIKVDNKDLITAFGQACSYKLFSHKSYIVIPKDSSQEDISKLDSLCLIFGIGLVLFDTTNIKNPEFEIRVRPTKHEPDMFYVNKNMKIIEDELFS